MCHLKIYNIFAVFASILIGAGFAALFAFGLLPGILTGAIITLILSSMVIFHLLIISHFAPQANSELHCLRQAGPLLAVAALLTQVFSLIGLIIPPVTNIGTIILVFLGAQNFALMLLVLHGLIWCRIRCRCD